MPTSPLSPFLARARGLAGRARTAAAVATHPEEPDTRGQIVSALRRRPLTRPVPLATARVAVAASQRLAADLAWEWTQALLSPGGWREELTAGADLVVVEVADGDVAGWPSGSASPAQVAQQAREHGIPTAVWVTGDLAEQAVGALREAFDTVLEPAPAAQVRAQSPAHDPAVNRVDVLVRHEAAADGRCPDPATPVLLEQLQRGGLVTDVWDLAEEELPRPDAALCAHYEVLLDVGRRALSDVSPLLDALATRTAVVTTPERAGHLPAALREHVAVARPADLRRQVVALAGQPELRDRQVHLAHRALLDGHTVTDRARSLLEQVGTPPAPAPRSVSVLVPTNRPHELDNVLANAARQVRVDTELVLLAHGIDVDAAELSAKGRDLGLEQVTVVPVAADRTLGAVLNRGIEVATGAYVAKMDDDNYYGPQFLGDLVDAFATTSAGITGKWAHYVWLRSTGAVVLRFERYENTYHRLVQGGSIVARREVAEDIRFSDIPRAVDSDFLNRAMAAGVQTWSGDRYNFISIRGTDRHSHTWQLDDLAFLTGSGRVVTYGDPRELVTL